MRREKLETVKHCECGCGKIPKPGNRFVHGHNGKFISFSEAVINKARQTKKERKAERRRSIGHPCECGCDGWTSPYCRFISGHNMRGKTKENHPGLAIRSENATGRTKENDPGRASQARKMTGRTKENNAGIALQAKKLTGRTKENDSGVARRSEKARGRTKENHPGTAAQAKKMSGSNHPNWKGGIGREPYCYVWADKEYKEDIKARDNYQCQNPDCWENEFKNILSVHHINYGKKDCGPFNLITLCKSCNARANFNRHFWQNFYSCLMASKQMSTVVNL